MSNLKHNFVPQQIEAKMEAKRMGKTVALHKNGEPCSCPFRNPVIAPGKIHGTNEMQIPACSNACQFFALIEHSDKADPISPNFYEVYLGCAGAGQSFYVDQIG